MAYITWNKEVIIIIIIIVLFTFIIILFLQHKFIDDYLHRKIITTILIVYYHTNSVLPYWQCVTILIVPDLTPSLCSILPIKSDPFLEVAKSLEGGGYTIIYRSPPVMKNLNPRWNKFTLKIQQLCGGDWERTLRFSVWDWNSSGNHDFIGSCTTCLRDICPERCSNYVCGYNVVGSRNMSRLLVAHKCSSILLRAWHATICKHCSIMLSIMSSLDHHLCC